MNGVNTIDVSESPVVVGSFESVAPVNFTPGWFRGGPFCGHGLREVRHRVIDLLSPVLSDRVHRYERTNDFVEARGYCFRVFQHVGILE